MAKAYLNRVTLIGYIGSDPKTIAENSIHEQITLNVITRDQVGSHAPYNRRWQHRVVLMDYFARQYAHLFLNKGDSVIVEGQLIYLSDDYQSCCGNNAEIIITSDQGYLRRLEEPPVRGI